MPDDPGPARASDSRAAGIPAPGSEGGALLPATAELLDRIGWFIRLRWVAVGAVTAFVLVGPWIIAIDLDLPHVLTTLALLAVYNAGASFLFRILAHRTERREAPGLQGAGVILPGSAASALDTTARAAPGPAPPGPDNPSPLPALARWLLPRTHGGEGYTPAIVEVAYFVNGQMLLDLVFLAVLIHFTGGIENPLRVFFLFHVIIAAILLSRWATYFYASMAFLLMCSMAVGEMVGWLPHFTLAAHWRAGGYADPSLVGAQLFLLGSTLYITAYMAGSIGARLRRRELDVLLLSHALEEKAGHLAEAYDEVSRVELAKSRYMKKVAHELRGPLGTIQTALKVALQKASDTASPTSLDLIRRAWMRAGELAEMTRELLALSRARDGLPAARLATIRPEEVSRRVLDEMRGRACDANVELRVLMAPSFPEVRADPEGFGDLLSNLLGNAVRYTPSGGSVTFGMTTDGENLIVEVTDTGIGIEKSALGQVFDEFYRSEAARSHAPEGTGLGLAIVKAVVDQHRGTIAMTSEEGRGTQVRVQLPIGCGQ